MRFLLLCPAALLLLTVPAKTIPTDSLPTPSTSGEPKSSSPPPTESTPGEPFPQTVSLQDIAEARAESKALNEENRSLEKTLLSTQSKLNDLGLQRDALTLELSEIRQKIRKAQDKLNTEEPLEGKCKPTDSELAKQIDEETTKQLDERKARIKRFYEKKYEKVLKELRLKIRRELELLYDPP
ncbi:chromatin assembly factor 1 subunit A-like [Drosophila serrata]|uniref:chromatin assembly factor 1 subunit A-like n=1 Tax=Drosophila serrata TaxID=7274 RepID=UPI000A1D31FE|nr:chromatin assembly factor 1 subunit A-like [Drosophila serrata]